MWPLLLLLLLLLLLVLVVRRRQDRRVMPLICEQRCEFFTTLCLFTLNVVARTLLVDV
jgi:hypothetical protein